MFQLLIASLPIVWLYLQMLASFRGHGPNTPLTTWWQLHTHKLKSKSTMHVMVQTDYRSGARCIMAIESKKNPKNRQKGKRLWSLDSACCPSVHPLPSSANLNRERGVQGRATGLRDSEKLQSRGWYLQRELVVCVGLTLTQWFFPSVFQKTLQTSKNFMLHIKAYILAKLGLSIHPWDTQ